MNNENIYLYIYLKYKYKYNNFIDGLDDIQELNVLEINSTNCRIYISELEEAAKFVNDTYKQAYDDFLNNGFAYKDSSITFIELLENNINFKLYLFYQNNDFVGTIVIKPNYPYNGFSMIGRFTKKKLAIKNDFDGLEILKFAEDKLFLIDPNTIIILDVFYISISLVEYYKR